MPPVAQLAESLLSDAVINVKRQSVPKWAKWTRTFQRAKNSTNPPPHGWGELRTPGYFLLFRQSPKTKLPLRMESRRSKCAWLPPFLQTHSQNKICPYRWGGGKSRGLEGPWPYPFFRTLSGQKIGRANPILSGIFPKKFALTDGVGTRRGESRVFGNNLIFGRTPKKISFAGKLATKATLVTSFNSAIFPTFPLLRGSGTGRC